VKTISNSAKLPAIERAKSEIISTVIDISFFLITFQTNAYRYRLSSDWLPWLVKYPDAWRGVKRNELEESNRKRGLCARRGSIGSVRAIARLSLSLTTRQRAAGSFNLRESAGVASARRVQQCGPIGQIDTAVFPFGPIRRGP